MAAAFTVASDTTVGDRTLFGNQNTLQLSTGDVVFMVYDPANANPSKVSLYVATSHITPVLIATLNASTTNGATFLLNHALPQCLALAVDGSDNLYVIGADGAVGAKVIAYQTFIKQSGLNWTQAQANYCATPVSSNIPPVGYVALWCNTGGGSKFPAITGTPAGHIIVAATTNDGSVTNACFILDAGTMLAGGRQNGSNVIINPAFIGDSSTLYGCNLDMSPQGFGATGGLCISASGTTGCQIGGWGVTATGLLTMGSGVNNLGLGTGTLTTTTKLRVRYDPVYGFIFAMPSATNAGQITVLQPNFTPTIGGQPSIDTGTVSNFPAPSATLAWDITGDPQGETWVYGWSTQASHLDDMLRVPVTFPGGTPTLGSVVTDNTAIGGTGSASDNLSIRAVKEPIDYFHVDWQSYDQTSPYQLNGDYSVLHVTPNLPQLVSPANNAAAPLASGGTFDWNFTSPEASDAQITYYLRFHTAAGYQWWNGTALTTAQAGATGGNEVAVTSATTSSTLPGSILSTGAWSWSVQVTGVSGVVSGYSPSWIVNVVAQPATPTLTATYDSVNNRTTLVVAGTGTDFAWFEYSDDGTDWFNVRGATAVAQVSGAATVYDWEIPANATRSYRVSQISQSGIAGNYSLWSSTKTATSAIITFWLRDPLAMTIGINPWVLANTLTTSFGQQLTEHNPPGRQDTVVIADVVGLEDGQCTFATQNASDDAALMALVNSNRTLLFETPDGRSWFVAFNVPRPINTPYLVRSGSYREHALSWRGQQRPPA